MSDLVARIRNAQAELADKPSAAYAAEALWAVSAAIQEIEGAWINPGPAPHIHYATQDRLRRDWPTLANALDRLTQFRA